MNSRSFVLVFMLPALMLSGCSCWGYGNRDKYDDDKEAPFYRSTFKLDDNRGNEDVLFLLALSGGGSRAAYFSTVVMKYLENFEGVNLLHEVDVISSVSGGSLPAAYYCVTKDKDYIYEVTLEAGLNENDLHTDVEARAHYNKTTRKLSFEDRMSESDREALIAALKDEETDKAQIYKLYRYANLKSSKKWDIDRVKKLMRKNYKLRWIGRWFLPQNFLRYWLTSFDRSDIMAQTFSSNLYGVFSLDGDLREDLQFKDLNPERPYLILNSTNGTDGDDFGDVFTFTREDFKEKINSEIKNYNLSHAVMASAAFPAAFSYVTLKNCFKEDRYIHLFDGGNSDNLGLNSIERFLNENLAIDEKAEFSVQEKGQEVTKQEYLIDEHGITLRKKADKTVKHIVILLVDSFVKPHGAGPEHINPRGFTSYFVDTNFIKTFDTLLKSLRNEQLKKIDTFSNLFSKGKDDSFVFIHLTFEDILNSPDLKPKEREKMFEKLNAISTDLSISEENADLIDDAVPLMMEIPKTRGKLLRLKRMIEK